jgi:hypothetical protein
LAYDNIGIRILPYALEGGANNRAAFFYEILLSKHIFFEGRITGT